MLLDLAAVGFRADLETRDALRVDEMPMLLTAMDAMFLDAPLQRTLIQAGIDLTVFGDSSRTKQHQQQQHSPFEQRYGLSFLHALFSTTAAEMQKQVLRLYKTVDPLSHHSSDVDSDSNCERVNLTQLLKEEEEGPRVIQGGSLSARAQLSVNWLNAPDFFLSEVRP